MSRQFKVPQSVLVVIHTAALDVLLIRRADAPDFWQLVTGSLDRVDESFHAAAVREVQEETGIDCGPATPLGNALVDWRLENIYPIYPQWRHRYARDVSHNTEHLFGLRLPAVVAVRLDPREHTDWRWLPWREAADACFSPSNAEAILMLSHFALQRSGE